MKKSKKKVIGFILIFLLVLVIMATIVRRDKKSITTERLERKTATRPKKVIFRNMTTSCSMENNEFIAPIYDVFTYKDGSSLTMDWQTNSKTRNNVGDYSDYGIILKLSPNIKNLQDVDGYVSFQDFDQSIYKTILTKSDLFDPKYGLPAGTILVMRPYRNVFYPGQQFGLFCEQM